MGSTPMTDTDKLPVASAGPVPPRVELLVLGAGPAGLGIARSAARLGLTVGLAAPRPERVWTNNFGVWADELAGLEDTEAISHRFDTPAVWLNERPLYLGRAYARLDTVALQRRLLLSCRHAGVTFVDARAQAVEHHERGSVVSFDDGARLDADVVVDATGYGSTFVERADRREPAYQSAYGEVVEVESHPYEAGSMALMDYRAVPGAEDAPTFLYAIPLSPTRLFVEETCLVGRPAVSHDQPRARRALLDVFRHAAGAHSLVRLRARLRLVHHDERHEPLERRSPGERVGDEGGEQVRGSRVLALRLARRGHDRS